MPNVHAKMYVEKSTKIYPFQALMKICNFEICPVGRESHLQEIYFVASMAGLPSAVKFVGQYLLYLQNFPWRHVDIG